MRAKSGSSLSSRRMRFGSMMPRRSRSAADSKVKAQIADLGGTVMIGSSAEFGKFIADETEKWAKVVKFSGAKPE
jgi:hypothetical protein